MGNKLRKELRHPNDGETDAAEYLFWCPGCKEFHYYSVPRWTFNGNMEAPTFTPSLLYSKTNYPGKQCHIFMTDGKIQYLPDCDHALAGKTVDMEDFTLDPL